MPQKILLGIIGGHEVKRGSKEWKAAFDTGQAAAKCGWVVVTGGLGGVMEAAGAGASQEGGLVLGILPQPHKKGANKFVQIGIATGLGEARNIVLARLPYGKNFHKGKFFVVGTARRNYLKSLSYFAVPTTPFSSQGKKKSVWRSG